MNDEIIHKYVNLILDEYIEYVTWDDKLNPEQKAMRKKSVQAMRKFTFVKEENHE